MQSSQNKSLNFMIVFHVSNIVQIQNVYIKSNILKQRSLEENIITYDMLIDNMN